MNADKTVVCPTCGEHNDPKYGSCWNCDRRFCDGTCDEMGPCPCP